MLCSTLYLKELINLLMMRWVELSGLFLAALCMMPSPRFFCVRISLFLADAYPLSAKTYDPSGRKDSSITLSNLSCVSYASRGDVASQDEPFFSINREVTLISLSRPFSLSLSSWHRCCLSMLWKKTMFHLCFLSCLRA